ncbi:hypothetical protein [Streptomyces purpurogeneiscleroticus]|uniref:hypothetical protein n=1 Tax=Streptomyces purpurogeneiscleroticus TaxID=68259 RepID=UPI001CBD7941|nr:hypothetical protein [Streptomyces purpurogeneiscleroticus]MBZ4019723.1 hypothetical protein [Streptomyces purpurogeneiscleroticus]
MSAAPTRHTENGARPVRLPWWAVALAVVSFVVLLFVMTPAAEAEAAGVPPAVASVVHFLARLLGAGV